MEFKGYISKLISKFSKLSELFNSSRSREINMDEIIEEAKKELLYNFNPKDYKNVKEKGYFKDLLDLVLMETVKNSFLNYNYTLQKTFHKMAEDLDKLGKLSEEILYENAEILKELGYNLDSELKKLEEYKSKYPNAKESIKSLYVDSLVDSYKKEGYKVVPIKDIKNDSLDINVIILKDPKIYIDNSGLKLSQEMIEAREALKKATKEKMKYYESKKYTIKNKELFYYL